jgi:hypothetical protein
LGNAERDIVTAATTPAHRNCSNVVKCCITYGNFIVFGLIQRIYRVRVFCKLIISVVNCVLNFVHTVSLTTVPVSEFFLPPDADVIDDDGACVDDDDGVVVATPFLDVVVVDGILVGARFGGGFLLMGVVEPPPPGEDDDDDDAICATISAT